MPASDGAKAGTAGEAGAGGGVGGELAQGWVLPAGPLGHRDREGLRSSVLRRWELPWLQRAEPAGCKAAYARNEKQACGLGPPEPRTSQSSTRWLSPADRAAPTPPTTACSVPTPPPSRQRGPRMPAASGAGWPGPLLKSCSKPRPGQAGRKIRLLPCLPESPRHFLPVYILRTLWDGAGSACVFLFLLSFCLCFVVKLQASRVGPRMLGTARAFSES